VFTGSRAEYGLQFPVLQAIASDQRLEYFLLVSGAHLQAEFGGTLAEIEADGFQIYREVDINLDGDSVLATTQAIGAGILSLSPILDELKPDFLIVYGDRYESYSAVTVGSQMSIPVAHIEGGDYTEGGALDDSLRHAMTKLAHIHFTTNEQAAERVLRLGEEPWRIHNVGLPALDLVAAGSFASPEEVQTTLQIDPSRPVILFCQHSVASELDQTENQVKASLEALKTLAHQGNQIIITYPNNDAGGRRIIQQITNLESEKLSNISVHRSLGRHLFHGTLNVIGRIGRGACVGNSSAGIKEAPAFGCPTVNIGSRQNGRLRSTNVIDVPYDTESIVQATQSCIEDEQVRSACQHCVNPYGQGNAGAKIAEILATVTTDANLLQKKMTY
jgi:UDP-hydrolysing UDP-N-acetyl-D-glucosamine 2-epimerase